MKTLIFLISILCSTALFSQTHFRNAELLDGWTFSKDTTIYVKCTYDYRYILQVEATSLAGTLDAELLLKHKLSNFTNYTYITEDTTVSKYVLNDAAWVKSFTLENTYADTLRFDFIQNNVTGGTIKARLKMYPNRE